MGHSYKLINAEVSVFRGAKYLSYPRENASILPVPDVDTGSTQVGDSEDLHLEPPKHTYEVVGVTSLMSYNSCVSCQRQS